MKNENVLLGNSMIVTPLEIGTDIGDLHRNKAAGSDTLSAENLTL